jgi:predicted nucleic acid-binding protein
MTVAVVDTSALIRLYVPDGPLPPGLEDAIEDAWQGDGVLMMPELALAEAAQVLWKKEQRGAMTPAEVGEVLEAILDLPIETLGHRDLLADAMSLAREHSLTVHDALFLAAALRHGASLITADQKLRRAFERLTGR